MGGCTRVAQLWPNSDMGKVAKLIYLDPELVTFIKERCAALQHSTPKAESQSPKESGFAG
jgi:hypothetical protein